MHGIAPQLGTVKVSLLYPTSVGPWKAHLDLPTRRTRHRGTLRGRIPSTLCSGAHAHCYTGGSWSSRSEAWVAV